MSEQSSLQGSGAGPVVPAIMRRCVVILCQPGDLANVGGVVRVMANFGLSRLRLVEPAAFDPARIHSIAHRGDHIVAATERFPSLVAALQGCGLVLGTTSRQRAAAQTILTPDQAAMAILASGTAAPSAQHQHRSEVSEPLLRQAAGTATSSADVALVFGPESTGLSNDDLLLCHATITIPTAPGYASLNLAQAALVIIYELWQVASAGRATSEQDTTPTNQFLSALQHLDRTEIASAALREEMFAAISDVLWSMHPNTDAGRVAQTLIRLRALLTRAVPTQEETQMLTQLCTHIAHDLRDLRAIQDREFRRRKGESAE